MRLAAIYSSRQAFRTFGESRIRPCERPAPPQGSSPPRFRPLVHRDTCTRVHARARPALTRITVDITINLYFSPRQPPNDRFIDRINTRAMLAAVNLRLIIPGTTFRSACSGRGRSLVKNLRSNGQTWNRWRKGTSTGPQDSIFGLIGRSCGDRTKPWPRIIYLTTSITGKSRGMAVNGDRHLDCRNPGD